MRIQLDNVYDVNMEDASMLSKGAYHHGNLRVALLEAGLQALAHTEAEALSLRLLAKQVGVSANAAYRHFADRDDLLAAMATEGFRRFSVAQEAAVHGLPQAQDRLRASGRAYVAFAQTYPALYRLMFQRLCTDGMTEALATQSQQGMAVLLEAVSALLQRPPQDEPVRVAAASCWALVHGLSSLAQGGQLAVFGLGVDALIDQVLAMPVQFAGVPAPASAPAGG